MKRLMITITVLSISGCNFGGPEVLSWDEEVLLNTGETIIVHRKVTYLLSGAPGNPLQTSMLPRRKDMSLFFEYHQKNYRYTGRAELLLLAISPNDIPNLIINPGGFSWDSENDFNACASPYYGQLIPDATGEFRSFLDNIEPWLYGFKRNITNTLPYEIAKNIKTMKHDEISYRYKLLGRPDEDSSNYIDPEYKSWRCGREPSYKLSPRDLGWTK